MTASKHQLTLAQRLAVFDRQRELERRADDDVTARMLQLQSGPDFNPDSSRLPHARPAPTRPAVVRETRRAVERADEQARQQAAARKLQLAAIAAGILPHTPGWERWRRRGS
jgi:hypothetical protein